MSRRETGLDPHDPGAEPRTADPQIENNSTDPAPSAAGELVSLLQADSAGERGNYQDPEEQIERQADAENAPVDWGIIAPLAVIIVAIVGWGLLAPESFSGFADAAFGWVINNLGWAFVLGGTAFVVFVLVIACSNFGTICLGSAD